MDANTHTEEHKEEAQPDFFTPIVMDCFVRDVQAVLQSDLLPRAATIFAEVTELQAAAAQTNETAAQEKEAIDVELNRLTALVTEFQSNIAQFLSFR